MNSPLVPLITGLHSSKSLYQSSFAHTAPLLYCQHHDMDAAGIRFGLNILINNKGNCISAIAGQPECKTASATLDHLENRHEFFHWQQSAASTFGTTPRMTACQLDTLLAIGIHCSFVSAAPSHTDRLMPGAYCWYRGLIESTAPAIH
jgi:hypothetical protein